MRNMRLATLGFRIHHRTTARWPFFTVLQFYRIAFTLRYRAAKL